MSNSILAFLTAVILCLLTTGCATQSSHNQDKPISTTTPPKKTTPITTEISTPTQFTFSIPQGHRVTLLLLSNKNSESWNSRVGHIVFDDSSCSIGHQISVTYKANNTDSLTKYFTKEAQWNKAHKLTLKWNKTTDELSVQVDDETFNLPTNTKVRFLSTDNKWPFSFEKIEQLTN